MTRIVLKNIYHLVTGAHQPRSREVDLAIEGSRISTIGPGLPTAGAKVIDCSTKIVIPGLVNTHHHMYQTLTRNVAHVQNAELFEWLVGLYPVWAQLSAEGVFVSTQLAAAELLKTGCTTTTDHHYLFPQAADSDLIARQIAAAKQIGIRFAPTRGSMSLGTEDGGLPPQSVVQAEPAILDNSLSLIERFHSDAEDAMCRLALAPCSPFSVSAELMQQTAELARSRGVRLHTHLAETLDEQRYTEERYGCRPLELMERWDWLGPDVWYAHGIHFNDQELDRLAATRTGVAHCPTSNMRLGSGICRVKEMIARGIRLGLGVDGSASNDSSDMLAELRNCLLLQRVGHGAAAIGAEDVLQLGTVGGAKLLGWESLGSLQPDAIADIAIFELHRLDYAGALSDPLAALIFSGYNHGTSHTIVNGELVVEEGALVQVEEEALIREANEHAKAMLTAAGHDARWMP